MANKKVPKKVYGIKKTVKYKRIHELKCFDHVNEMLAYGHPSNAVAQYIQDQGEYTDVGLPSLAVTLRNYRNETLTPGQILTHRRADIILEAKKQYTDKLEELRLIDEQLEKMVDMFDLVYADVMSSGVMQPEARHLNDSIIDMLFKMFRIKIELGITGAKTEGTLVVSPERLEEIRQKYGDAAARAMADPVSRAKVLSMMRSLQDAVTYDEKIELDGEVVDMEEDE